MLTRTSVFYLIAPAVLVAGACGSSEDSSGAQGSGPGPNQHEQPPQDDPPNDLKTPGEPGGDGGAGGAGMGGNGASAGLGGTGNVGAMIDAGASPTVPAKCVNWQPSQGRVEPGDTDDTISATRAREAINLGFAPAPTQIRARDFFNYYGVSLPAGNLQGPLQVTLELRARAVPNEYDLFVGVQAPEVARPRTVLTVLVDTTPSMAGIPLGRAKLVLQALGAALTPGDSLLVLTTDGSQGMLEPDLHDPAKALAKAAEWLAPSSTGNIEVAVKDAYASATSRHDSNAWNRVVFISDGAEPPDLLPTDTISGGFTTNGIRLVGVGTGPTLSYRERLLEKATHYGHGPYVYVDNEDEAKRLFQTRFDRTFGLTFEDVRIELGLPFFFRQVVDSSTSSQSNGGDPATPQGLAPGATIATVERLEVCDATVFDSPGQKIAATVRWLDPTGSEASVTASLSAAPLSSTQAAPELDKALAIKAYALALKSVDKQRVLAALKAVEAAQSASGSAQDADLLEIHGLLEAHPANNLP